MYSADDELELSGICGVRCVYGVCEMCMCLAKGWCGMCGGEWVRGLSL